VALFGLTDLIWNKIVELLQPILGPLRPLVKIFGALKENTIGILSAAQKLVDSTEQVISDVRNFKAKPQFKNRVISVPRAVDNVQALFAIPDRIIAAVKDLVSQLRNKVDPAAFNVEELEGLEDLRGIIRKFGTKLAAGFEKLLGIASLIVDALVTIRASIDDLQTIVDSLQEIVSDFSNLDGLFLPQNNPRRTEALREGGSIKIRVGSLHS